MCGIVGYVGKEPSKAFLLEGLAQLEYRGYDSMGVACFRSDTATFMSAKVIGGIEVLKEATAPWQTIGSCGISHSRWATHGQVTQENAHPHFDCQETIALVHNGIIENYQELKSQLTGHTFRSETDSEVVAHYFEQILQQKNNLHDAVVELAHRLKGAFALVIMVQRAPGLLIALRKKSPLCIGHATDAYFVASDPQAFIEHTSTVTFLKDESFAFIQNSALACYNFHGDAQDVIIETVDKDRYSASKQHFSHYMIKEIHEQKRVIYDTIAAQRLLTDHEFLKNMHITHEELKHLREIELIGCGTSTHAAAVAQHFLTELLQIPVWVHTASEYRFKHFFSQPDKLSIFLSQSGETADTLEALREAKRHQGKTLAITNVPTSTITREADGVLLMQAQREISVASTKCFTAQIALLYVWAVRCAVLKGAAISLEKEYYNLMLTADALELALEEYKPIIKQAAVWYAAQPAFIFLGRNISYSFALEAALKLKEIAYKFVDCYPAGELKHGHIALIEENFPVFIFSVLDEHIYTKLVSNAQEVKARKGHVTVFAFEGQHELIQLADQAFIFKRSDAACHQLVMTGVMQYLMFEIAHVLGRSIDKPRNLAKSVTVE